MGFETAIYHKERINERSVSEFYGLCLGILSDGAVNESEAKFLLSWLDARNRLEQTEPDPLVRAIYSKLKEFLSDNKLDPDEERQLLGLLVEYTGAPAAEDCIIQEPTSLPVTKDAVVEFKGKLFCFTGTFAFGVRGKCVSLIEKFGAEHTNNVVMKLDYLVIGHHSTPDWLQQSYGRKIMKAVEYRDEKGKPISIINEKQFIDAVRALLKS